MSTEVGADHAAPEGTVMPRLAVGTLVLCISTLSRAQSARDLQLDGFRPTMDSRGYLTLNGAAVLDHGELSFGLGALEWGRHLLAFHGGGASYSVDDVVSATLVSALGLRLAGVPLEVGAPLPCSVMCGTQDRPGWQGPGDLGLHSQLPVAPPSP